MAQADDEYWEHADDDEKQLVAKYQHPNENDKTILQGLTDIDWANIEGCYTTAAHIPSLLRALLSDDVREQLIAQHMIEAQIFHQGTLYEVTEYVIPFIVRLLPHVAAACKLEWIYTLTAINYWSIQWSREHEEQHTPVAEYDRHNQFVYEAVWDGIEHYFALADDPNDQIRHAMTDLIITIPNASDQILAFLLQRATTELDAAVRARSINAFTDYYEAVGEPTFDPHAAFVPLLLGYVASEAEPLTVRFAAATALTHFIADRVPEQAVVALAAGISRPKFIHPDAPDDLRPHNHEFYEQRIVQMGVKALGRLPASQHVPALIQTLEFTEDREHAHDIALALLSTTFLNIVYTLGYGFRDGPHTLQYRAVYPYRCKLKELFPLNFDDVPRYPIQHIYHIAPKHSDPAALTEAQRAAVRAVIENEQVWMIGGNLLAAFGLPAERDEARRLLT